MAHDNPNDPEGNELWNDFVQCCEENDIDMTHKDDWIDWWKVFLAGAAAQFRISTVGE